ncbi:MAG: sigma 54-interacting transcriptional regulator [Candidatus Eisenbacteria bacterium]
MGESPVWRELLEQLPRVARSGLPVLLLGETGTGKELVARALHLASERAAAPFVAHNCGATPDTLIESELFGHVRGSFTGASGDREGLFDAAEGGTLFLDEIGDASALLQTKLLRVLQEGEARRVGETRVRRVDVRVIAATHRSLDRVVGSGGFRSDLYFRLGAVKLRLPPLRERGRDVLMLARHFLAQAAARAQVSPPALAPGLAERLLAHRWPGNVRELANACHFAVRVAGARGLVTDAHWPEMAAAAVAEHDGLHAETRALEERRLREALVRTHGNKTQAARALGLSRQGLIKKLQRYGLGRTRVAEAVAADAAGAAALDDDEGAV